MYYSNQTLNHGASASVIVGVEKRNVTMRCIFAGRYVTVLSFIHTRVVPPNSSPAGSWELPKSEEKRQGMVCMYLPVSLYDTIKLFLTCA